MPRFLYSFGYETPKQWKANEEHEWDDESSGALWIEADDEESAIEWGAEISEASVRRLLESSGEGDIPSWKGARFAHWIDNPLNFSANDLAGLRWCDTAKCQVIPTGSLVDLIHADRTPRDRLLRL